MFTLLFHTQSVTTSLESIIYSFELLIFRYDDLMHAQMVWREWLAALPFMTHSSFSVVAGGSCPPWSTLPSPSACRFGHITSSPVECEQRECVAFQTKTFRSGLRFDSFSLLLPRGATDARKPDTKLTSGEDVWCLGISILGHFLN